MDEEVIDYSVNCKYINDKYQNDSIINYPINSVNEDESNDDNIKSADKLKTDNNQKVKIEEKKEKDPYDPNEDEVIQFPIYTDNIVFKDTNRDPSNLSSIKNQMADNNLKEFVINNINVKHDQNNSESIDDDIIDFNSQGDINNQDSYESNQDSYESNSNDSSIVENDSSHILAGDGNLFMLFQISLAK